MRKMACIRNCHGFRGGYWNKGEVVDVADGEDVPRHFVPVEDYDQALLDENRPKPRVDVMKAAPSIYPIPAHLRDKGGISQTQSTVKTETATPAAPKGGIQKVPAQGGAKPGADI